MPCNRYSSTVDYSVNEFSLLATVLQPLLSLVAEITLLLLRFQVLKNSVMHSLQTFMHSLHTYKFSLSLMSLQVKTDSVTHSLRTLCTPCTRSIKRTYLNLFTPHSDSYIQQCKCIHGYKNKKITGN
jgi:hypothetical protein